MKLGDFQLLHNESELLFKQASGMGDPSRILLIESSKDSNEEVTEVELIKVGVITDMKQINLLVTTIMKFKGILDF